MFTKQISVFVENKHGQMAKITHILAEKNINIQALSIADTTDFGILRMITNNPKEATEALREKGIAAKLSDVIAVRLEDKSGGLTPVMDALYEADIAIEYLYATVTRVEGQAIVILCTEDMEKTVHVLLEKGIMVLSQEVVYGN